MYYCNKEWNIVEFIATRTLTFLHHPYHPHGLHAQIIKESVTVITNFTTNYIQMM